MKKIQLLSVSARIALMLAACVGSFLLRNQLGGIISLILLVPALAILIQLVIWGSKWVKTENVSELGLHIVRFWVILTALALSVFTMLTIDYSNQHDKSIVTELEQTALAGSFYLRGQLTDSEAPGKAELTDLSASLDTLLLDNENNSQRSAVIYLFASADEIDLESTGFRSISDTVIAAATDDALLDDNTAAFVTVSASDLSFEEISHSGMNYISARCPLYTHNGKYVGYLEICEYQSLSSFVFRYANLELFLSVAALIALFCFLFYGVMQLVDIVLRPRRFDPTRILPFGRESIRPLMFFITLAFFFPMLPMVYSEHQAIFSSDTVWGYIASKFLPSALYIIGACLGLLLGSLPKNKLMALPAVIGLVVSLSATIASVFIDNVYISLSLLLISGLGISTAYRIGSRYKEHADSIYGSDDYAYLCPCLGGIAGVILGVVCSGNNITYSILSCSLIWLAALICVLMLRDVDYTTKDDGMNGKGKLTAAHGSLIAIIMPGAACAYLWVCVTHLLYYSCGKSMLAVSACAAAPFIAFCFGNRLRLVTKFSQRCAIMIGGLLAALSFIPMAIWMNTAGAVFTTVLVSLSVIFTSAAIYSILQPAEMRKAAAFLRILILPGIAIFGYIASCGVIPGSLLSIDIWLYICAGVTAALTLVFALMSNFPERDDNTENTSPAPEAAALAAPAIAPASKPAQEALPAPKPEAKPVPKPEAKPEAKPASKPEAKPEAKPAPKPEAKLEAKPATKPEAKPEAKPAPKPEAKPEAKPAPKPEAKPEAKPAPKPEAKPEAKPAPKPEAKPEAKPAPKPEAKPEAKPAPKPEAKPEAKPAPKPEAKPEAKPAPKPEAKPAVQNSPPSAPQIDDVIVLDLTDETNK